MHLFVHGYHRGRDAPGSDVARYEAIMEVYDIAAALVVGYEGEGIDPDNNAYLRSLAVQRPWMSTVAYLPVSPPPTVDHLDELLTAGHRGTAVHCLDAVSAHAVANWPKGCWELLADRGALSGSPGRLAVSGAPYNRACAFPSTRLKQAPWAVGGYLPAPSTP